MNTLFRLLDLASRPHGYEITADYPLLQRAAHHLTERGLLHVIRRSNASLWCRVTGLGKLRLHDAKAHLPPGTLAEALARVRARARTAA